MTPACAAGTEAAVVQVFFSCVQIKTLALARFFEHKDPQRRVNAGVLLFYAGYYSAYLTATGRFQLPFPL